MRKLTTAQKATAAIAIGALGVAGSGIAYAYWTTSGSGSGSASAQASNGTVRITSTSPAALAPGESETFTIKGDTTSATDLRVTTVQTAVTTPTVSACAQWFSVADVDASAVTVPHGDGTAAGATVDLGTATLVFANSPTVSQDACKSVAVVLTFNTVSTV
ncbi:MAG: hypothetical protein Q8R60_09660 [Mycobacteriales bacterium]|nr:hypothetical protein [Mycobacteriales bacterium]